MSQPIHHDERAREVEELRSEFEVARHAIQHLPLHVSDFAVRDASRADLEALVHEQARIILKFEQAMTRFEHMLTFTQTEPDVHDQEG